MAPTIIEELTPDPPIRCRDYIIGCVGAGFIMADVQIAAYRKAGFKIGAIASRTESHAKQVAERWNIERVYAAPSELIQDPGVEIVDLAFPPDQQPELVRLALKQKHVRGILAQKPLAMNFALARALVHEAAQTDKAISVNQNMRYDQSMRVLKQVLVRGDLGQPVMATIDMRAIPHWQPFLAEYERLTLLNMSIHHLDVLRFLFGEPTEIFTSTRADPRTPFSHQDGICVSTLNFENGVLAVSLEDVWSGPKEKDFDSDIYIKWRVEGTEGVAQGTIGWPDYPDGSPSTFRLNSRRTTEGKWIEPTWQTRWFSDAFAGVMEQLQYAIKNGTEPVLSLADNLKTMALVEAGYVSIKERRAVRLSEFLADINR
ncbi:MAG: Gfo/Idh/MocA family oxidoreductase [Verrucomicrobia bacterium]|nr:Gfo/Idh/MocA family oxidoreductase [Verrucomicrobiota bacterium]